MIKKLFRMSLICVFAVTLLTVIVSAATTASGTCGGEGDGSNLTWTLSDNGTLTISGTGAMKDWDSSATPPWPYNIKSLVIGDGVTSIGRLAFCLRQSLTTVKIGAGVTSIGDYAFDSCSSLTTFTVSSSNTVYASDSSGVLFSKDKTVLRRYPVAKTQTTYTVPNTVTRIADEAFYECDNLTTIKIGDNVTKIDHQAFAYCNKLAFVEIGSGVTSIDYAAFRDCPSLEKFTVSGDNPKYCSDESGVLFSKNKASLIKYPAGIENETYSIPASVTSIGLEAFSHSGHLTSMVIPGTVVGISQSAFSACDGLTSVVISDGVTRIGTQAFYSCRKLTSVVVGDDVTSIGDTAFYDCSSLSSVVIGDSVTSIGRSAFRGCRELTSMVIPASIKSIGDSTFSSCKKLTEVIFLGDAPSFGGSSVFYSVTATCYYPPNNTTWTDSVKQQYNGTITWKPWSCENIGKSHTAAILPAVAPGCIEAGLTEGSNCSVCGEVLIKQEVVPAIYHKNKYEVEGKAPTCTEPGLSNGEYCPDCKTWLTAQEFLPAINHQNKQATEGKAPTCTNPGLAVGEYCPDCGTWLTAPEPLPATNHANKYAGEAEAATCTTTGKTAGEYCPDCDTWLVLQEIIPASGHSYENVSFLWSADLTEATASAACHCGEETSQACVVTWDNTIPGKLTATATAQLEGETFTDSREISAVVGEDTVTVTLPADMAGVEVIAASYDGSGRMVRCEIGTGTGETITVPVGGGNICAFFVDQDYHPISALMQLNV